MKILIPFLLLALFVSSAVAKPACCKAQKTAAEKSSSESLYQFDASWTDQHGKAFKLSELKGAPVLLTMGYATCTYACPRLATDLRAIEQQLPEAQRKRLSVVFVSIDPERDTPAILKSFLESHRVNGPRWHAVRGEEDAVLELSVALGIRYRKVNETDFAHSNVIALLSPDGTIVHRLEGLGADPSPLLEVLRPMLQEPPAPTTAATP